MTTTYIFPSNSELMMIERDKLPRLTQNRPIFEILPLKNVDSHILLWEQLDNIIGLQQVRGLNGAPLGVNPLGGKSYEGQPGVYGEYIPIDEIKLTARRQWGSYNKPVDITDLVMEAQDQLLERRLNRIEYNGWRLLIDGTFSALGHEGQVLHTDTYTLQSFTANVAWSTPATSTPLADLRQVQIKARGHSVNFGRQAKVYMNQVTANYMFANTNAADLYGRRVTGLATINSQAQMNELLTMDNLPNIVIYEEGYYDANNVFQLYLADGEAVVVGVRQTGVPIGNYQFTRNANNPDMAPGPYMRVIDTLETKLPREINVHDGHNGGPVLMFPSAICRMLHLT